jgi:hypothetical protein
MVALTVAVDVLLEGLTFSVTLPIEACATPVDPQSASARAIRFAVLAAGTRSRATRRARGARDPLEPTLPSPREEMAVVNMIASSFGVPLVLA